VALKVVDSAHIPAERTGNKADLANWFGVSLTTADQWLRRGCPYLQRGERGKEWRFDYLAVAKWKYGVTDAAADDDPEKLNPKERLDWYRGTRERTRHQQEIGELIPAAEYEQALSSSLKQVAVTLESLPDLLERDAGLPGPAVEKAIIIIDALRERLYKALGGG
jgi:phage terminase Nu1 subunit (DNA packaging protein)